MAGERGMAGERSTYAAPARLPPTAWSPRRAPLARPSESAAPNDLGQLVPLGQERVVALDRLELAVRGVHARGRGLVHERADLRRPVQDVALDAEAGEADVAVARGPGTPPRSRPGPGRRRGRP